MVNNLLSSKYCKTEKIRRLFKQTILNFKACFVSHMFSLKNGIKSSVSCIGLQF